MPLIILTAVLAGLVLATSSLEPSLQRPLAAGAGALLMLAASLAREARRTLADLLVQHWLAGLAFLLWLVGLALQFSFDDARADALARLHEIAAILGFALAGAATAAIAKAYGRSLLAVGLLLAAIPVAFVVLLTYGMRLEGALGRITPDLNAPGLLASFGLLVILAAHQASEELRRRPSAADEKPAPLMRRLFAPVACFVTSLAMMALAGAAETLGAVAAGALVFAGALWPRARRSRVGGAVIPALAAMSIVIGVLGLMSAALVDHARAAAAYGADDITGIADFVTRFGIGGAILAAAPVAAIVLVLSVSKDHGRRPSRGAPLIIAASAYTLLASFYAPGIATAPAAFLFAIITGLAASYLDSARKTDPA